MKKSGELHFVRQLVCALFLVAAVWYTVNAFTIVSHAQSQGKVTADSAKIRQEASTSSEAIGSADKDASVTINGQTTGADGNIWYQVFVDADTLGYIRSDLVSITDGSTPTTLTSTDTSGTASTTTTVTSTTTTGGSASSETPAEVTEVNPVSATVTGGQAVRVRANASTTSNIVTTAESGLALTVTGTATGTDGREWYQVSFAVNGSEVTGFIRSDYVDLSEELTAPEEETPAEPAENTDTTPEETAPEETQKYEVTLEDGEWYLIDNEESGRYKISEIFDSVDKNGELYLAEAKNAKTLKAIVIVLVIIIIVLIAALTMMIFRAREATDAAFYAEAERETARRRSADRPQSGGQSRPRPAGTERTGERPRQGQTKAAQGQARPTQGQTRTAQNPAKAGQSRTRTAQGQKSVPEQRTVQNPSGQAARGQDGDSVQRPQGQRSEQSAQTQRIQQSPQGQRSQQKAAQVQGDAARKQQKPAQSRKPKNFMTDDDEFEFEFLNWDGEDDK